MSSLSQLRDGLGRVWDNIAEGWQHLSRSATQALTRFNPVNDKDRGNEVQAIARRTSQWGLLTAEMEEKANEIIVRLEAPGMEAGDFDIQVIDKYLVIRGEKRAERQETRGHYTISECAYGRFERALELPAHVDDSRAKARYKRGVLNITLPRRERNDKSRITVNPA